MILPHIHGFKIDYSNTSQHISFKNGFVIIADDIFYNYNGEWNLNHLRDWHNDNDLLNTFIVNLSYILDNSSFWVNGEWGDGNPDNPFNRIEENGIINYEMFNDSAAKIRNYLRYAYHLLDVRYALLVGDTDINGEGFFPVRYVYARGFGAPAFPGGLLNVYHEIIPTDMYYACLNGTFNADEDENNKNTPSGWGENATESSDHIDECDWEYEIAVGRFPVDNFAQLENMVRKTISYMELSGDEEYLYNITLAGHYGGWGGDAEWGANYSKTLNGTSYTFWNDDITFGFNPDVYNINILDANPNRDKGLFFNDFNAHNILNTGCHIWYQGGHGTPYGWVNANGYGDSFTIDDIQLLNNDHFSLILSAIPCNTASFDIVDDCFIEQWVVDNNGAFAAIGNTRYGWGSYDGGMYGYWNGLNSSSHFLLSQLLDAFFNPSDKYIRLGDCLFDGKKEALIWHDVKGDGTIRWATYEQILMGSPAVRLKLPSSVYRDPDPKIIDHSPILGSFNQEINPTLSVSIIDEQGDLMKIIFRSNASGTWKNIGFPISFVGNGTYNIKSYNMNQYKTKYWWSVHIQELDSGNWTNATYFFTTGQKMSFNPIYDGWRFYKKIHIDHDYVSGNLSNFPILISVIDTDLKDHAQFDGDDIIFMDDLGKSNRLYHEIENYDSSFGELITWVNIPSLNSNQDTIIYMYYGNKNCENQEYSEMVWNNKYIGVWHLNHVNGEAIDSTSYNLDGIPENNPISNVNCKIGKGVNFGEYGDEKRYNISYISTLDVSDITVSCWAYITDNNVWVTAVSRENGWQFATDAIQTFPNALSWWSQSDMISVNGNQIRQNRWSYIIATMENSCAQSKFNLYIDGVLDLSKQNTFSCLDTGGNLYFGDWVGIGPGSQDWAGKLDEIRLSNVARTPEWILTEYNNQNHPNSFIDLGEEVPLKTYNLYPRFLLF